MLIEDVTAIVGLAIRAPSGDNLQPWRFLLKENRLSIFNKSQTDKTSFDYREYASYVAHGALIENIRIAATHWGYEITTRIFPTEGDLTHVADIVFELNKNVTHDPLRAFISSRNTNRYAYQNVPLTLEEKQALGSHLTHSDGRFLLIEEATLKQQLADAMSLTEYVLFRNNKLRHELFSIVNWSNTQRMRWGITLEALGVNGLESLTLKLLRITWMGNLLSHLGVPNVVRSRALQKIKRSSAIGVVTVNHEEPASFVSAGTLLQRVWLQATQYDLSLQPYGVLFLDRRVRNNIMEPLMDGEAKLILHAAQKIHDLLPLKAGERAALIFRIGHPVKKTATSFREAPAITYLRTTETSAAPDES